MSLSPQNTLSEKLFKPLEGGEFERADEWSLPKAITFGDMDIIEEKHWDKISNEFFECAERLVEQTFKNEIEDFIVQYSLIYLYRHSFECQLKHVLTCQGAEFATGGKNGHSLTSLLNKATGIDKSAKDRLQELNDIDPSSTLLRYGGVGGKAKDFMGTELRSFQEKMRLLHEHLSMVAAQSRQREAVQ